MVTCAVVSLVVAAALWWYIRSVRRPIALTRGYEQIKVGMARGEAHHILGAPDIRLRPDEKEPSHEIWDAGSVSVLLIFKGNYVSDKDIDTQASQHLGDHTWWADLYYWAEKKWDAIFSPRRRHR